MVFWLCLFKYLWKVLGKDFVKKEILQYSTEMSWYIVLWCNCSTKSCKFLCFCGYSRMCMMTLRRAIRVRCSSLLTLQILQQELPLIPSLWIGAQTDQQWLHSLQLEQWAEILWPVLNRNPEQLSHKSLPAWKWEKLGQDSGECCSNLGFKTQPCKSQMY